MLWVGEGSRRWGGLPLRPAVGQQAGDGARVQASGPVGLGPGDAEPGGSGQGLIPGPQGRRASRPPSATFPHGSAHRQGAVPIASAWRLEPPHTKYFGYIGLNKM